MIEADDEHATFCLSFEEEELSGLEALSRLGLPVTVEDYGAGEATVCRIGDIGCRYPDQPCFCECPATGDCTFWGYYRDLGSGWEFSLVGAADTKVRDGSVEGWRYGPQTPDGGNAPRVMSKAPCREGSSGETFLAALQGPDRVSSSGYPLLAAVSAMLAILAMFGVRAARRRRS